MATPPVHRESIVSLTPFPPSRGSITTSVKRKPLKAYDETLPSQTTTSSQAADREGTSEDDPYTGWMSKLCVEPNKGDLDANTCCLGFWVPCALYGKTNWRLTQINGGRDATDSSWKSNDGCNTSCWAWYGAWCFCPPIAGMPRLPSHYIASSSRLTLG